jgi:hypothetical protein
MNPYESTLFWIFIVIFSITAIVTLLGITGVIKNIKERYLNALFTALILEVVAAVVILFREVKFEEDNNNGPCLENVISRAGLSAQIPTGVDLDDFLVEQLKNGGDLTSMSALRDSLSIMLSSTQTTLEEKEAKIRELESDMDKMGQRVYAKITRLHDIIPTYGSTINLNWAYEDGSKDEVYELLIGIFGEMGLIAEAKSVYRDEAKSKINYKAVQAVYINYRKSWGFPPFPDAGVYLDEANVVHFLQTYLKKQ